MTGLTISEALDKLASEGDADQIAAHLRRLGIRGAWESDDVSVTCPVARYVAAATGRPVRVSRHGWAPDQDFLASGTLPPSVSDFVAAFDKKGYPELIEDGSDG